MSSFFETSTRLLMQDRAATGGKEAKAWSLAGFCEVENDVLACQKSTMAALQWIRNCVDVSKKGSVYNIVALHKKARRLCQIKLFTIKSLDLLLCKIGLFSFSLDNCQLSELFIVATKWLIFGFLDFLMVSKWNALGQKSACSAELRILSWIFGPTDICRL